MGGRIDVYIDVGELYTPCRLFPLPWRQYPLLPSWANLASFLYGALANSHSLPASFYSYLGFLLLRNDAPVYAANKVEVV